MRARDVRLRVMVVALAALAGCGGAAGPRAGSGVDWRWEAALASYGARQSGGTLVLTAEGYDPSPGYVHRFFEDGAGADGPEFVFRRALRHPDRPTVQVLTRFSAEGRLAVRGRTDSVVVRDGQGRHVVRVGRDERGAGVRDAGSGAGAGL